MDQLIFILQGFGLVMVVLTLLWFVSSFLGFLVRLTQRKPKPSGSTANVVESAKAPAQIAAAGAPAKVPAAHLAAITAAVAVATSGRGRVVRVLAPAHGVAGWVGAARTSQMLGRRTRWDWRTAQLNKHQNNSSIVPQEDAR